MLVHVPLACPSCDSKIQQRKKAEKESRGTLEYFVRLSGPENEVLAVANYGFGEHAAYSLWVILAAAD